MITTEKLPVIVVEIAHFDANNHKPTGRAFVIIYEGERRATMTNEELEKDLEAERNGAEEYCKVVKVKRYES